jgi:hypothetical protein
MMAILLKMKAQSTVHLALMMDVAPAMRLCHAHPMLMHIAGHAPSQNFQSFCLLVHGNVWQGAKRPTPTQSTCLYYDHDNEASKCVWQAISKQHQHALNAPSFQQIQSPQLKLTVQGISTSCSVPLPPMACVKNAQISHSTPTTRTQCQKARSKTTVAGHATQAILSQVVLASPAAINIIKGRECSTSSNIYKRVSILLDKSYPCTECGAYACKNSFCLLFTIIIF